MRKPRISRLLLALRIGLVLTSWLACAALKFLGDGMSARAERLVHAMAREDKVEAMRQLMAIESWSRTADTMGWAISAVILLGGGLSVASSYFAFRPVAAITGAMKRFTSGDRDARAPTYAFREYALVADGYNELADVITGQHEQMLRFLGSASEELRDPLHIIDLALGPFVAGGPLPPEAVIRRRLAIVSREAGRLAKLVQTYLDASRVEWKRLDLQLGRQDVGRLVEQAASMYREYSARHQVEVSVPARRLWARIDPMRVSQVIHTLVVNAIQASPAGGVIEVVARAADSEAIVEVVDHGGVGIPEDQMRHVFEPFRQIAAGGQSGPGTSVAMSVAKRLVEAHGGRIEFTSEPGEGSTFRVRLPLAESRADGPRPDGRMDAP
jgi:signal transduction histidine kinase